MFHPYNCDIRGNRNWSTNVPCTGALSNLQVQYGTRSCHENPYRRQIIRGQTTLVLGCYGYSPTDTVSLHSRNSRGTDNTLGSSGSTYMPPFKELATRRNGFRWSATGHVSKLWPGYRYRRLNQCQESSQECSVRKQK